MRSIKLLVFGLLAIILGSSQAFAQKKMGKKKKHQIIMQLTSNDVAVHKGLVKQLNNLKEGWGEKVAIEVVCHGPGIDFLNQEKTTFKDEIYKLKEQGIVFVVCENSLKERKVSKESILPNMDYVKMGIGEIVEKQEQGWVYIKAGF
ncbi:MAG: DsrE family protein [Bacteroidia bacterium]|nr:DsrE family protein [Bacteroidia bacterium]